MQLNWDLKISLFPGPQKYSLLFFENLSFLDRI